MDASRRERPTLLDDQLDAGLQAAFGASMRSVPSSGAVSVIGELVDVLGGEVTTGAEGGPSALAATGSRYELQGEIARGGMGVIIRGRDNDLGRDVAMKVLQAEHARDPEMVRRFVEEAQIAGQLQHPGVLQVYELGLRGDNRPYFTMKLIRGQTLAQLLAVRSDPDEDRRRFLRVFEQACQTMAYAHARGVVHRDLKPANIMVGNFGEVQIVDWGLAKLLGSSREDDAGADHDTVISIPSAAADDGSIAGTVMGTPAYMPPEQARGETSRIDRRADVFALGAILCQILTGDPPYTGRSGEALDAARSARLRRALDRLDAAQVDPELRALVKSCLAADPADRPADARLLAEAMGAYLASVEERAMAAEVEAAEARAKVAEERRARRLTVALAGVVLVTIVIVAGGVIGVMYDHSQRVQAHSAQVDEALADAQRLLDEATEKPVGDQKSWIALRAAGMHVAALDEAGPLDDETRVRAGAFLTELGQAERDRQFVERIEELVIEGATNSDIESWRRMEAELRGAFRDFGTDLLQDPPDVIVRRLTRSGQIGQIADGLELWIATAGRLGEFGEPAYGIDRMRAWIDLLYALDADKYRTEVRRELWKEPLFGTPDLEVLRLLASAPEFETALPRTLAWLGFGFGQADDVEGMDDVFRRALLIHHDDFMLNFDYGYGLYYQQRWQEAIRYFHRALTVRPETGGVWRALGATLLEVDDVAGALEAMRQAVEYQPEHGPAWHDLGRVERLAGNLEAARAALDRAIALDDGLALAHGEMARVHDASSQPALADPAFLRCAERARPHELAAVETLLRAAIDHGRDRPLRLACLALNLQAQGRFDEARPMFEQARDLAGQRGDDRYPWQAWRDACVEAAVSATTADSSGDTP